jgi:membrane dipeptidase
MARIVHSTDEMLQAKQDGLIAILHAVEGAHSLGGRVENLTTLAERGVCMLTLAHFYQNEVVAPVHGIPEDMRKFGCFKSPKDPDLGLGELGPPVIEEMLRLGMIIDLTHCTEKGRGEIYPLCGNRRPLLFSHVGVQPFSDDPMSPTHDEMKIIADTGGVIGVIFMNYWLGEHHKKDGLHAIVATVHEIINVAGSDAVAIGTDYDGFTDPPDDLDDISEMPKLTDALLKADVSSDDVEKILGKNMERVLRDGWR